MIIRITSNGGSFRGAGAYYLHDKSDDASIDKALKPQSAERVWFTETRNCMNNDPFRALDEMWGVAEDQAYLKMQAGVKRGGRVCEEPVKTMSLSWHKDDAPSPEHMIEAADAFLKHMKWDKHQAVLVGHNDTEHRHVHIILNRVNPDTGRTLDDFREQKRAQSWALEYERSQDQVRCEQREIKAQKQTEKSAERANDNQREVAPTQQAEQFNQPKTEATNEQQGPEVLKTLEREAEPAREATADQNRAADEKAAPAQQHAEQSNQQQDDAASQQQPEVSKSTDRTQEPGRETNTEQGRVPDEKPAPIVDQAANDHLPHNVIMMARPSEREFNADEQLRAEQDATRTSQQAHDRAELKTEQRAEREAFFKDGAKLFKATRHAVYDEVRQEYKSEWRDFYKDSDAARKSAEASSETAVGRAFHFAKDGQWDQAREAFNDRDSVRDATEKELADRKADLKQRQNDDLRERQHDACDALRQVRDVQYQELLQRQRDERAAFRAGETLEALGIGRERQDDGNAKPEKAANENRSAEVAPVQHQMAGPSLDAAPAPRPAPEIKQDQQVAVAEALDQAVRSDTGGHIDLSNMHVPISETETKAPARGTSDLAAGGIGALANYLADQLGELFAPTPPEVREANGKAEAKAEATRVNERPARDDKAAAYDAIIESAVRAAEEERARHGEAWWKERDKGKGWERDQ
jgi:hypothetical protein